MYLDEDEMHPDEPLPAALLEVVRELRADVRVSPGWRRRVLGEAAGRRRRGRLAPYATPSAVAAGVLLVAGGLVLARTPVDRASEPLAQHAQEAVRFSVVAPAARRVSLVGDFNVWDPRGVAMHRGSDGHTWTVEVPLPPGRHAFAYMVDGKLRADPAAPKAVEDDFGSPSSVIVVGARRSE